MTDHDDAEPSHAASPTDHVLSELQLFGYRPFDDEPDPRPLPEGKMIAGAVAGDVAGPAPDGEEMTEAGWFDMNDPPEPLLGSTRLGLELFIDWQKSGRFQVR